MAVSEQEQRKYSPENSWEVFRTACFRYSAGWLLALAAAVIAVSIVVNESRELFVHDYILFSEDDSKEMIYARAEDGLAGNRIKIMAEDWTIDTDKVTVSIYIENRSGEDFRITGETFMLSSFNTRAAEIRDHYYPDKSAEAVLADGESLRTSLSFSIHGLESRDKDRFIFTLSAFRKSKEPSIEIILN